MTHSRPSLFFCCIVALPLLFGCGEQNAETVEDRIMQAWAAMDHKKPNEALIHLKNALKGAPRNSHLRAELAKVFLAVGDGSSAEIEISKAIEFGYDPVQGSLLRVRAQLLQKKFDAARNTLDGLGVQGAADLEAYRQGLIGQAALAAGNVAEADAALRRAVELNADDAEVLAWQAYLLAVNGDVAAAGARFSMLQEKFPDRHEVWSLAGTFYRMTARPVNAVGAYGQAVELKLNNREERWGRALANLVLGDLDAVETDALVLGGHDLKDPRANFLLGVIAYARQNDEEAVAHLTTSLEGGIDLKSVELYLGGAYYRLKQHEQAEKALVAYLSADYRHIDAHQIRLLNMVQLGDVEAAAVQAKEILQLDPGNTLALSMVSANYLAEKRPAEAAEILRRLAAELPETSGTYLRLGLAELTLGRQEEGIAALETAKRLMPDDQRAVVVLVLQAIEAKDYSRALRLIDELQAAAPDSTIASSLRGAVFLDQGEFDRAREFYNEGWEIEPGNPVVARSLARLEVRDGDIDRAIEYLGQALEKNPGSVAVRVDLVQLYIAMKQTDEALSVLKAGIATSPESPTLRIMLAQVYQQTGHIGEALATVEAPPSKVLEHPGFLEVAGQLNLAAGRYAQALELFDRLTKLAPNSSQAHLYRGLSLRLLVRLREARGAFERALMLDEGNVNALSGIIALDIDADRLDSASRFLSKLHALDKGGKQVLRLEARYFIAKGERRKAAEVMGRLIEMDASSSNIAAAAELYMELGQEEDALRISRDWLALHPDDLKVGIVLANLLSQSGRIDEARKIYEESLIRAPNNPFVLNNLAVLLQKDEPSKALIHAKRAYDLTKGREPAIADTYGWLLLGSNPAEALSVLRVAYQGAPEVPEITFHYAAALHAKGFSDEAKGLLEKVVKQDFSDQQAASALLRQIVH